MEQRFDPNAKLPEPLQDRPTLYPHLKEVYDAYRILASRASGATGRVTIGDIIDYYDRIISFEGTAKEFLVLFTAVENAHG